MKAEWNFDIDAAPRGVTTSKATTNSEGVVITKKTFTPDKVLVAASGKMVMVSYWMPPQKDRPNGRWHGLATGEQPIAWMPFPDFPEGQDDK